VTTRDPSMSLTLDNIRAALGGRYIIEREIGRGGMAVVYLAKDVQHDRDVAVKVLDHHVSQEFIAERFLREIHVTAKLSHPNIIPLLDSGRLGNVLYYVTPFAAGESLRQRINRERQLPLRDVLRITSEIADALDAAHQAGVVHRDVKPENVIVGDDGTPRLMDFGIAIESSLYRGEESETVPGTPQFLAPELLRGEMPSQKTDVYAMGVLLYEMFTGRVPFDDNDTARLVRRVISETAPRIETLRPDLPPELRDILERAIAKDPDARFPDALSLSDAISAFEGQVLDRVLAEVSVTRAKMVKLMVILEANKALATTFDNTEILRIILKTATSETDAERGTIFLTDPDSGELVSQILEGGSVSPIRLAVGTGIVGAVAKTGQVVNIPDAYQDIRFDKRTDASSGFKTICVRVTRSSPADASSGCRSRWPWSATPRSPFSTSSPPAWIRRPGGTPGSWSSPSATAGSPCCWSPTSWRRPSGSVTGSP